MAPNQPTPRPCLLALLALVSAAGRHPLVVALVLRLLEHLTG